MQLRPPVATFLMALTLMLGAATARVAAQPADPWWKALPRPVYATLDRVDVGSDWFEVYRIAPGVTAIYEPGHFEEAISYLIEGTDRAILFDTLLGIGNIKAVVDRLTRLPVMVVNSHSHVDHIGGDHFFTEVAVYDSDFARERLAKGTGNLSRLITADSVWKKLPEGFDPQTYETRPIAPTKFLRDGEVIDIGGRRLEVLHTPGHTPDSLCLLDRGNRILFTGDTYYPATLYAYSRDANLDDYVRSAGRLGALQSSVDIVCPAHNEPKVASGELGKFARAFEAVKTGRSASKPEREGVVRHEFEGIQILTRPQ